MRVVHTGSNVMNVRDGAEFRKGGWGIDPSVPLDVYETYIEGESKKVSFTTDRDSISFDVLPGKSYRFAFILNGKDSAFTEIRGIKLVPRARFSKAYQQAHRGKTSVEIPPMYELLNVVFALTDKGRANNGLIPRRTPIYRLRPAC